jgi:hypothetical protein
LSGIRAQNKQEDSKACKDRVGKEPHRVLAGRALRKALAGKVSVCKALADKAVHILVLDNNRL